MMTSRLPTFVLALGALALLAAGCFPVASMRWSDDGSVGLVAMAEKAVLVDGKTGRFTQLPEKLAGWAPSISPDGKLVVYSLRVPFEDAGEALTLLPKGQWDTVIQEAARLRAEVLAAASGPKGPAGVKEWPSLQPEALAKSEVYRNLVIRSVCKKADESVRSAVAPGLLEKAMAEPVHLVQLYIVPVGGIGQHRGRLVTSSLYAISRPRLSPDRRFVAYLCHATWELKGEGPAFDLWVSPLQGEPRAVRLARRVSLGYAWRPDSRAIAYMAAARGQSTKEEALGTLNTIQVADDEGKLLAKAAAELDHADHVGAGDVEERAGLVFNSLAEVAYHPSGRILFSSVRAALPLSHIESGPQWSIFVYDPVTRTLADALPPPVSAQLGSEAAHFDLSPDGARLLMLRSDEGFMVYRLGDASATTALAKEAAPEKAAPPPAWKGPDHIACYVKGKSSLLKDAGLGKHADDEGVLVEVDAEGKLVRVLVAPEKPKEPEASPAKPKEPSPKEPAAGKPKP